MFVLASKYNALLAHFAASEQARVKLLRDWNALVARVNAKGGEALLNGSGAGDDRLTDEDIKRLLMLCHPDKHGGKPMAEEMTKKLLALRER